MKRLALLILTAASIGGLTLLATNAFFSDTETSTGNTFQAGQIDLKIDNTSYYNGAASPETSWEIKDLTESEKFFDFRDLKPGDYGEDTISAHVYNNDSWLCANVTLTSNNDNGINEPEGADGDVTDGAGNGELAGRIQWIWWADDGDNVLETDETVLPGGTLDQLGVGNSATVALADSATNIWGTGPLPGDTTRYIGKAWCFGAITLTPIAQDDATTSGPLVRGAGFTCNGAEQDNTSQTDSLTADISFSAVQSRNNPDFFCTPPTTTPSVSPSPTPPVIACTQADVMLVLDRSGSINSTELGDLKTAGKAFVDALGLTTTGIHAGMSSFSDTGSLNQHLTDTGLTVKNSIDALASGGFTNLKEGIDLAKTELDNPGDGHDRADGSSPDKMIIITDGQPNRPLPSNTADDVAKASADAARAAGVEVFVVGVGSDVNTSYLQTVADNAAHYFSVSDYSGLQTTLQNLDLCD